MKKIIVANWKMNPESSSVAQKIIREMKSFARRSKNDIVICPPFSYLYILEKSKKPFLGAQDVSLQTGGAFTGEVGIQMLKSLGVSYVIVGHSERRALGETDGDVSKKAALALKEKIRPIVCIGEKERTVKGDHWSVIERMLRASLFEVKKNVASKIIVAYEPIWAIGDKSKGAMEYSDIHESVLFIRKILSSLYDQKIANSIPILYGGSVDLVNARDIIKEGGVTGLLIGRQSIKVDQFKKILNSISSV